MSARKPSYAAALRVWWGFTWRWLALMLAPAVLVGVGLGLLMPGSPAALAAARFFSLPIILWAQVEAIRRVVNRDYPGFSLRLIEPPAEVGVE